MPRQPRATPPTASAARPLGAELLTRQDVRFAPPDILITNYSMLSIMLTRPDERSIFQDTAEWLAGIPQNQLPPSTSSGCKGTQGTEVAYLLRRLLHRLGLETDSPQLSVLGRGQLGDGEVSAKAYLSIEFFGQSPGRFRHGAPRRAIEYAYSRFDDKAADALARVGALTDTSDNQNVEAVLGEPVLDFAARVNEGRLIGAASSRVRCTRPNSQTSRWRSMRKDATRSPSAPARS